jgi:hypothetical protein
MPWKVSLIVSFLCGLLSLQERSWAQDLRRMHYGTTNFTSHLPVWVAKNAGYFANTGLNVEPMHIRRGALITMGIISGQLQFSGGGAESVVAARIEGGDVVLLARPVYSDPVYLMARPEIKSAGEIKGKSAVIRLGSITHYYLRTALRYVGLDSEKDLTILHTVPDRRLSALWRRHASPPPRSQPITHSPIWNVAGRWSSISVLPTWFIRRLALRVAGILSRLNLKPLEFSQTIRWRNTSSSKIRLSRRSHLLDCYVNET